MPPKIERYATQPKKAQRFEVRTSTKMGSFAKSVVRKYTDFKRYTVPSNQDKQVYKDGQIFGQTLVGFDYKKKSFVVSKRKTNKSILDDKLEKSSFLKQSNKWIQKVQHQSYQGLRQYNQDRILIKQNININEEEISIFAVFDGHGGSSASQYLQLNFCKTFQAFCKICKIDQALVKTIEQLQNKILKAGMKINSGSCATILLIKQNHYWAANVGDSRILIVKDIQQCQQITQDHKPQNPNEYKRIQSLGGKIYRNVLVDETTKEKTYGPFRVLPSRLSVTRAIGDYMIKKNQTQCVISAKPDIFTGKLEFQDVILLISDGAYEQFSNSQISIIFSHKTKQSLKQRLVNYLSSAAKKHTSDNTSVIAIQIKQKDQNIGASTHSTQPSLSNFQIKL